MKRWEEVRARMRFGFTDEQHERANRAFRDAWVRYQVLKMQYRTDPTAEEYTEVLCIMREWWDDIITEPMTEREKHKCRVWFKTERRKIWLDQAEHKRPGAKKRIKRMREMYRRRK